MDKIKSKAFADRWLCSKYDELAELIEEKTPIKRENFACTLYLTSLLGFIPYTVLEMNPAHTMGVMGSIYSFLEVRPSFQYFGEMLELNDEQIRLFRSIAFGIGAIGVMFGTNNLLYNLQDNGNYHLDIFQFLIDTAIFNYFSAEYLLQGRKDDEN